MPDNKEFIIRLRNNIERLKHLYEEECEKSNSIQTMYDKKVNEVTHLKAEIAYYKTLYEDLVAAKSLSLNEDQRLAAKHKIDQMMREINRCINLIK